MNIESLIGFNNRFLVETIEEKKKEDNLLVIPDEFEVSDERYMKCRFLAGLPDTLSKYNFNYTHCLVMKHLLEETEIDGETYKFISANGIVCAWEE